MEYLKSVKDPLKKINDKNFKYLNLFKYPPLVFGTNRSDKVDFCKYPKEVRTEIMKLHPKTKYLMEYHKASTCGCRIRFKTTSRKLIFRIKLRRGYNYKNMVMWNSSALSIYTVDKKGKYHYKTLLTPSAGKNCFAEAIRLPADSSVCIFLPSYDTIEEMYIGFEEKARIFRFNYPKDNRLPVIFYGGSAAQGASATKSSNSYPNIVSRKLNRDIINYSITRCCKATPSMAKIIGQTDCDSIVIDYSRDAKDKKELMERHEKFYKQIRQAHPDRKIILLTTASFNGSKKYEGYDEIIQKTYENALSRGEKTHLINQRELFKKEDYDIISFNNGYYTDYAMFKLADKICEIINS
ncbi:SGNH/GDSL hydrolase family protein [Methanosphaera sp. ISO3-F5]|uniref:SGNH/GDSL hydrolase family protein n=1 Tax=Methanosphaera sp. ISO3-F5 TaxID=1452353 RepID=UPI002B25DFC4|nr:SGNH/GDSL hydrolase family protein [Methanosphaera sp. ISO3-F5]WQH63463.1 SGNH/GDSL hydrolase family protein [Methanosphaera sp. ISO3-F5]